MPIVKPEAELHSPALQKLAELFNETLGFCPNSVLTITFIDLFNDGKD